ncbi:DUF1564 family protein [Leptospira langatensis]|uniref:DUF1564 family protein n=1 Tax=Leptospira langatensis TaxID=2484983 RepID=A0A5F1ZQ24_9LEPT|nr:DUF1564 family protein [Leptospira langatensis]TGK01927.1 DUF1564 family protein [Leptospira langatensis]TGL39282.1 DUF1564 family protein [Leptospira langatensis]
MSLSVVFQKDKVEKKDKILKHSYPSTALIPLELWEQIPSVYKNNFQYYLGILRGRYSHLLRAQDYLGKSSLRTTFQEKGLNLIRHSYRPIEAHYQELKSIAIGHGVSINLLIALMIFWDSCKFMKKFLSDFWNGRKPPAIEVLHVSRVLDLEAQEIRLFSFQCPTRFYLPRGSTHWI